MDLCSLFLLLWTFFGGYDLYIIAIISPLEPERAAEARRAVVASSNKSDFFEKCFFQKLSKYRI